MKDALKEFWLDVGIATLFVIAIFLVMFFFSGCKVLKNQKISTKDSTSVNNSKEGSIKSDSSGSKADRTSTKETVYYPQPIYIEGKNGEAKIIFVPQSVKESGTEKLEQAQIIRDTSWKEAIREMTVALSNKELEKKTKVGPSFIEWILIAGIALLYVKDFLPFKIITKT
jgi:hypothetical protein